MLVELLEYKSHTTRPAKLNLQTIIYNNIFGKFLVTQVMLHEACMLVVI